MEVTLRDPNQAEEITPWQMNFRQIEPGELQTRLTVVGDETFSVTEIALSLAVHQQGIPPAGTLTFGRATEDRLHRWQGRKSQRSQLLSFGTINGFDSVSHAGFIGNVLSFDDCYLEKMSDELRLELPEAMRSAGQFEAGGSVSDLIKVDQLLVAIKRDPKILQGDDARDTLALLVLLLATNATIHEDKSRLRHRLATLKLSMGLMETYADEPLAIGEICRLARCSWRTLDRVFKEEFGIGPKAYYMRLRLGRARADLLSAKDNKSVVDVANFWGFWHMGQFARDYKKMYGELPSSTLASQLA
ncbi:helix-turn-helix transcriptional regulator [Ruegeria sp. A3M17]|uniref:helix-turn-helix transcriptional regulator n=1 Tax=Ruegeria sp. A3M17 TaxID=2267229 RepID=UPI000DE8816B|nr:helix-turn-helix transcriptional regulator [Ruegeria sp. A3M17]RBW63023.1 hypothetical protein DS906_00990 [Ruegeria sp. A3M17]